VQLNERLEFWGVGVCCASVRKSGSSRTDAPPRGTCLSPGDTHYPTVFWLAMFWKRVGVLLGFILNHENGMMRK